MKLDLATFQMKAEYQIGVSFRSFEDAGTILGYEVTSEYSNDNSKLFLNALVQEKDRVRTIKITFDLEQSHMTIWSDGDHYKLDDLDFDRI